MPDIKRRLIFLWPYLNWGGGQVYLIAIMKEARGAWDVTAVIPRRSSPEIVRYIEESGASLELIDTYLDAAPAETLGRKLRRHYNRLRTESAILRSLKRFALKDAILHIDLAPWYSWTFYPRLAIRGANVFVTAHNTLPAAPAWRRAIWKARMQIASRLPGFHLFTSNHDTKNALRGWVRKDFWETIKVTYTCVNPIEIDEALLSGNGRDAIRARFGLPERSFVVLCVGQFIDRKGRWVFLDAAKELTAGDPNIRFVWLTPKPPDVEELEQINTYGLGDSFLLVRSEEVGSTRQDILSFYKIADVFALPSFVEGLPIALLEAMAMGIPSISTDVNAIPEAVFDRKTGLLIEPGDPSQLAAAIEELRQDAGLRQRISDSGREFVKTNFDERVASRIAIAEYNSCLHDAN